MSSHSALREPAHLGKDGEMKLIADAINKNILLYYTQKLLTVRSMLHS